MYGRFKVKWEKRLLRNSTSLRYNRKSTLQSHPEQQCFQSTIKHRLHVQKLNFGSLSSELCSLDSSTQNRTQQLCPLYA